jgi:hypothetical protein
MVVGTGRMLCRVASRLEIIASSRGLSKRCFSGVRFRGVVLEQIDRREGGGRFS